MMGAHRYRRTGIPSGKRGIRRWILVSVALCLIVVVGISCGGSSSSKTASPSATAPSSPAPSNTVWLCRPGLADNPCESDLTTTVVSADGTSTTESGDSGQGPADRLLLRVPDGQRPDNHERQPEHRPGRDGDRRPAGGPLLAGVQGVRPDVPAVHREGNPHTGWGSRRQPATWPTATCSRRGRTTWPTTTTAGGRPDRPLPGHGHVDPTDRVRDRPQPGRAWPRLSRRC